MQKTPRNKMITTENESIKMEHSTDASSVKNLGKQVTKFYFPHLGRTVEAETFEEAKAIINNEEVK